MKNLRICLTVIIILFSADVFSFKLAPVDPPADAAAAHSIDAPRAIDPKVNSTPKGTIENTYTNNSLPQLPPLSLSLLKYEPVENVKPGIFTDTTASGTDKKNEKDDSKDTIPPWGYMFPGQGIDLFKTKFVSMNISPYGLFRYINQLPAEQTSYFDHNGVKRGVDTRNDFQWHRVIIALTGFLFDEKFKYSFRFWSLNATNNNYIIGTLGYDFCDEFKITAGVGSNQGTYSLHYSHPLWLGTDRVLADEFFRPGFSSGIWINGELFKGFYYSASVMNSLSQVAIKSSQLDRGLAKCVSFWWRPTTHEFGPLGGYGDYEDHKKVATTFGASYTQSIEDRYSQVSNFPDNTQVRLSDATLPFETGAFAPGVTVGKLQYQMASANAGAKYKGFFVLTEFYYRLLNRFDADGPIPINEIDDWGFYVQSSFFPIKKRMEVYLSTSQIFGYYNNSDEYIVGVNVFPFHSRNIRLNTQVNIVNFSAASSQFGYYIGGLRGTIFSLSGTVFF